MGITQLVDHGDDALRWVLVIVAEGYTVDQQALFDADCEQLVARLFSRRPFSALDGELALNVWRLEVISNESGLDDPAACGGTGATAATYFDATLCGDNGVRREIGLDENLLQTELFQLVPEADMFLVLINSDLDGGSRTGSWAAVTKSFRWLQAALHEIGHIFGLGDEYDYLQSCTDEPALEYYDVAVLGDPTCPNLTVLATTAADLKWVDLVLPSTPVPTQDSTNCAVCNKEPSPAPLGTIGAFEGAGYHRCGLWRPAFSCLMRDSTNPDLGFCPVCARAIRSELLQKTAFHAWPPYGAPDVEPWNASLEWTAGLWEVGWEVQISKVEDFSSEVFLIPTADSKVVGDVVHGLASVQLDPGEFHYWRVRRLGDDDLRWTTKQIFHTASKQVKTIGPHGGHGEKHHPWELEFSWNPVAGAHHYEIQIADTTENPRGDPFAKLIFKPVSTQGTKVLLDVSVKAKLLWRVRALPGPGRDHPGEWSATVPLETTMPEVVIDSPGNGEEVYPWPVVLKWLTVKGADHYLVEMSIDEAGFGPDSFRMLKDMGVDPKVIHPGDHVTFNMPPRYLAEHDQRFWRVRVVGPPPLSEEGTPDDSRFVNHGDPTVVELIWPPGTGGLNYGTGSPPFMWTYREHPPGDSTACSWDATLGWKPVVAATAYVLWLRAGPDNLAFNYTYSVAGPDDDPWEVSINTYYEDVVPPPGVGVVGYDWGVFAIGPEEIPGLGQENRAAGFIEPDRPKVVSPDNLATGVARSGPIFSFTSNYTPSEKYRLQVFGGGLSVDAILGGNPGGVTAYSPDSFGESELKHDTLYAWQVRAHCDDPGLDAVYPWGPLCAFTTELKPPPQTPVVFSGGPSVWSGTIGVMLCFFEKVAGANHYRIEAQLLDKIDVFSSGDLLSADPVGEPLFFDFWEPKVYNYTAYVFGIAGVALTPAATPVRVIGLTDTLPINFYRWRIQACADDRCSAPSEWCYWSELIALPPSWYGPA